MDTKFGYRMEETTLSPGFTKAVMQRIVAEQSRRNARWRCLRFWVAGGLLGVGLAGLGILLPRILHTSWSGVYAVAVRNVGGLHWVHSLYGSMTMGLHFVWPILLPVAFAALYWLCKDSRETYRLLRECLKQGV